MDTPLPLRLRLFFLLVLFHSTLFLTYRCAHAAPTSISQAAMAQADPSLELTVLPSERAVRLSVANLSGGTVTLRYYLVDLEELFSSAPFARPAIPPLVRRGGAVVMHCMLLRWSGEPNPDRVENFPRRAGAQADMLCAMRRLGTWWRTAEVIRRERCDPQYGTPSTVTVETRAAAASGDRPSSTRGV